MDFLVEFLESGGARIIKDPLLIDKKKHLPNVLLSPDISHLVGVSPSFWVREGDTIGTKHPQENLKQVLKDLSEVHSYSTKEDAPFSVDSKFIEKVNEVDARREKDIHNVLYAMKWDKKDLLKIIAEMDEKYTRAFAVVDSQFKKRDDQLKRLGFAFLLGIILVKLL